MTVKYKNMSSLNIPTTDTRRGWVLSQVRCYDAADGVGERSAPRTMFSI